jgi:hypothetical protein
MGENDKSKAKNNKNSGGLAFCEAISGLYRAIWDLEIAVDRATLGRYRDRFIVI